MCFSGLGGYYGERATVAIPARPVAFSFFDYAGFR
jgi:hypothetical protein